MTDQEYKKEEERLTAEVPAVVRECIDEIIKEGNQNKWYLSLEKLPLGWSDSEFRRMGRMIKALGIYGIHSSQPAVGVSKKLKRKRGRLREGLWKEAPELVSKFERLEEDSILTIHQDAFACDYQEREYVLLGKAVQYARTHNAAFLIVGRNRETINHPTIGLYDYQIQVLHSIISKLPIGKVVV